MSDKKQLTQLGRDVEFMAEVVEDFINKYPDMYLDVTHCENSELAWVDCNGISTKIWPKGKGIVIPSGYYE